MVWPCRSRKRRARVFQRPSAIPALPYGRQTEYDKTVSTATKLTALNSLRRNSPKPPAQTIWWSKPRQRRPKPHPLIAKPLIAVFITVPCCSTPTCRLANHLQPDQKKLQAKGITSVRGRWRTWLSCCRALPIKAVSRRRSRKAFFKLLRRTVDAETSTTRRIYHFADTFAPSEQLGVELAAHFHLLDERCWAR